jgi:hypothetical protein
MHGQSEPAIFLSPEKKQVKSKEPGEMQSVVSNHLKFHSATIGSLEINLGDLRSNHKQGECKDGKW